MNIETRLQLESSPPRYLWAWREWLQNAERGWLAHRISSRRVATERVKFGFHRVPPRVWARHGALLVAARQQRN